MNWNEKYRAMTLDDIKGQEHVISRMKALIKDIHNSKDGDFPHLLLYGQAGTGKNCAVECFLRDCFGESWKNNLISLNASDERKIDTIRTKVKDAAKRARISTYKTVDGREKDIPFNIIFLDEGDALTPDAQGALRRIIEEFSHITRFIFTCNYEHKIIGPIKSRCMVFRFRRLSPYAIKQILEPIIEKEQIKINDDAFEELCKVAKGDARSGQNILQNAWLLKKQITIEMIDEISGKIRDINLNKLLSEDFNELWDYIEGLFFENSMDTTEIIYSIMDKIKSTDAMIDFKRDMIYGASDALYRCSLDNSIIHIVNWIWNRERK